MSTSGQDAGGEAVVRRYLLFLEDPTKLVDPVAVKGLQGELDRAEDPVDRLRAYAALQRAQAPDGGVYRHEFVTQAKRWAAAEGVPADAFRFLGVPEDVLAAAGLIGAQRGRRAGAVPPGRRAPGGRVKGRRVVDVSEGL